MQIQVLTIEPSRQKYAIKVDGHCNHAGELVQESLESNKGHTRDCWFCDNCGSEWNPYDQVFMETTTS